MLGSQCDRGDAILRYTEDVGFSGNRDFIDSRCATHDQALLPSKPLQYLGKEIGVCHGRSSNNLTCRFRGIAERGGNVENGSPIGECPCTGHHLHRWMILPGIDEA